MDIRHDWFVFWRFEDVECYWGIVQGPYWNFWDSIGLFRVIWCLIRVIKAMKGSLCVSGSGYCGLVGLSGNQ